MSAVQTAAARKVFQEFDTDNDKFLSKAELHAGLWKLGDTNDPKKVVAFGRYVKQAFKKADRDVVDGRLDFDEFYDIYGQLVNDVSAAPARPSCSAANHVHAPRRD